MILSKIHFPGTENFEWHSCNTSRRVSKGSPIAIHARMSRANSNNLLSLKHEYNDSLAFQNVLIQRLHYSTIQMNVYRKDTWTGQYINFISFAHSPIEAWPSAVPIHPGKEDLYCWH